MSAVSQLDLTAIQHVEFYKRDELTTDLVCCDIRMASGEIFWFHEEMSGWSEVMTQLQLLQGFRRDWQSNVIHPPFAECRFTAYEKLAQ